MSSNLPEPVCVMHVLYSLGIGGAEKLAFDMIGSLPPERYRAVVLCIGEHGPLAQMFEERGQTVYYRPNNAEDVRGLVSWTRGIIAKERVTVIHAHQYNPLHYSVLALLGNRRVNLVYTEHGRMYPEVWNWKRYLTNPFLALRVNHMVSISGSTRNAMARYDNFPRRRIRVIHNGIDLELLNPAFDVAQKRRALGIPAGARVIGTASRLEEIKNIPMMLRGFKKVLAKCPECVLLVAGHGSQAQRLKALAAELGIGEQVLFLGLRHDLPELFKLIEVFLLVSFTEGISITLLEAMGSGVPAVVTRTGGNPEVVLDGETGYLIEVGDEDAMAAKVLELLASPEQAARLGGKGVERVERHFSFGSMMEQYLELYRTPQR